MAPHNWFFILDTCMWSLIIPEVKIIHWMSTDIFLARHVQRRKLQAENQQSSYTVGAVDQLWFEKTKLLKHEWMRCWAKVIMLLINAYLILLIISHHYNCLSFLVVPWTLVRHSCIAFCLCIKFSAQSVPKHFTWLVEPTIHWNMFWYHWCIAFSSHNGKTALLKLAHTWLDSKWCYHIIANIDSIAEP